MRACKDCQWLVEGEYRDHCAWGPQRIPIHFTASHWCAQFHRKETEEGEGKDPNA